MLRRTWDLARRMRLTLALLVLLTSLGMPTARIARAADCLVTSTADSGANSLRAAINNTDGFAGCTAITFQAGLGPVTLDTRLDIDHAVTITGPGQVVRHNPALPAAANGGVFGISVGTVVLNGLTIQGGRSAGTPGAGLRITGGSVTLDGVTVRDNIAQDENGGGIAIDSGALHLINTLVENNRTETTPNFIPSPNGGGIYIGFVFEVSIGGDSRIVGNQTAGNGGGIFNLGVQLPLDLADSTVSGNKASVGGGIYTSSGPLNVTNTLIEGNEATVYGGGIFHLTGTMTLTDSIVRGNTTTQMGGGIVLMGLNPSRTTVRDSIISDNSALNPGGDPGLGGGIYVQGTTANLTVQSSTISGNAADNGGGIYNLTFTPASTTAILNVTISGNTATGDGGGLFNGGAAMLRFATVTGNIADSDADGSGSGGGIIAGGIFTVGSSILVGNRRGAATPDDCGNAVPSAGYNLAGAGCPTNGTTDIAYSGSTAAVLNPTLADNGGPTKTHALVAGSPARNHGDNATCNYLLPNGPALLDQRGVARNDGQCDIGAFESERQALTVTTVGGGAVGRSPAGTGDGPFTYPAGTVVTLTAQPTPGNVFLGWTLGGNSAGWASSITLTMEEARQVTATFVATPIFGDIAGGATYADPVVQLAARGVINGCDREVTPPLLCPSDPILRAQMAALIVRVIPGWADETWENPFSDSIADAELWSRVATLGHYQVAQGYQAEICQQRGVAVPCFGPLDDVTYGQTILFITRAMVAKGYWVLQPDNRAIFPDQNGVAGADPTTDRQTLDHRAVVTYVFYAGAPPDVDANPGIPFRRAGVDNGGWGDASSRGWFARALWLALNSYFGTDGTLPDGRPAGGLVP